jgi:aminopeptidase
VSDQSEKFRGLQQAYAEVIVNVGANVQPDQLVHVSFESVHRELGREIIRAAYKRGASYVFSEMIDPFHGRIRVEESPLSTKFTIPKFETDKFNQLVEERGALISIVGSEFPDAMVGLDVKKVNDLRMARFHSRKLLIDRGIGCSEVQWTVAAAATVAWGERIFPYLTPPMAEAELWKHLFAVCRVEDGESEWRRLDSILHKRRETLNQMRISRLHFRGEGTDLKVGLGPYALFKGGSEVGGKGVAFQANIPTEEVFTTPDCRIAEGVVRATRPFLVNGVMIKGLTMHFMNGELVEWTASEGQSSLDAYLASDDGAKRLGEVALVGIDSPIYQSGVVFQEILLDENAACHIALGSAYKFCVQDGASRSAEELRELGVNESSVHTDIMISNDQTSVDAELADGAVVRLLEAGRWCI